MFGFITIDKDTINPRDYAYFNSFYCGLCMALKKRYGNKSRLFNNFDCAFLLVFLNSYQSLPIMIEHKHCAIHWFKKVPMLQLDNFTNRNVSKDNLIELEKMSNFADKIADVIVLLVKGKILDNSLEKKQDVNKTSIIYKKIFEKASMNQPEIDALITEKTKKIYELENANGSIDELAHISGEILQDIVAKLINVENSDGACAFFYNLGKWIYYIDAIYDLENDYKTHKFNPFIKKFNDFENRQQFVSKHKFELLDYLNNCLIKMQEIYNSIKSDKGNAIIENVIYQGLMKQQNIILTNPDKKLNM